MDPLTAGMIVATLVCGAGIGFNFQRLNRDFIINETIMYMIENGYALGEKNDDGEWEILPVDKD